jgi:Lrp/AsnC ligand binding domain
MTMNIDADTGLDANRHEAIVCVRLKTTVAGSHLLEHLRTQPFVVSAWWIAADIDAVVLLSAPSMRQLHRAVDDLRLLGGANDVEAHMVLRRMGLPEPSSPISY